MGIGTTVTSSLNEIPRRLLVLLEEDILAVLLIEDSVSVSETKGDVGTDSLSPRDVDAVGGGCSCNVDGKGVVSSWGGEVPEKIELNAEKRESAEVDRFMALVCFSKNV